MTGNALEYFSAFARCCPPHPELPIPPDLWLPLRTRRYSIKHCRKRIKLGMLMMSGTMKTPPQVLSGLPVLECFLEMNMHSATNKSPMTFAYDVNASAINISPNFPSCASAKPPMLILFSVATKRDRPLSESLGIGRRNARTRMSR